MRGWLLVDLLLLAGTASAWAFEGWSIFAFGTGLLFCSVVEDVIRNGWRAE